jgi:hypothetical protein
LRQLRKTAFTRQKSVTGTKSEYGSPLIKRATDRNWR